MAFRPVSQAIEFSVSVRRCPLLLAYDRETGKPRWKSKELPWRERMPTYFAPTMVAAPGGVLYTGGGGWKEHAGSMGVMTFLDAATGKVKWQAPHLPSGYQSPQDIFVIGGRARVVITTKRFILFVIFSARSVIQSNQVRCLTMLMATRQPGQFIIDAHVYLLH